MLSRQIQITTHSVEETQKLGKRVGLWLEGGNVVALTGDIGSGKTSFVQGIAQGLEVPGNYYITSPTYTLINEYPGRYPLFHIDLFRIENNVDFEDIGLYEILNGAGVVVIEWADRLHKDYLSGHVVIHFEILDDNSRKIFITVYGLEKVKLIKKIGNILAV